MKKVYLLSERGSRFYITADSIAKAEIAAEMYGAKILAGPLPMKYLTTIDPKTISVVGGVLQIQK